MPQAQRLNFHLKYRLLTLLGSPLKNITKKKQFHKKILKQYWSATGVKWRCQTAMLNSVVKWRYQMALSNGVVKRLCQTTLSNDVVNDVVKPRYQMVLTSGVDKWLCQTALSNITRSCVNISHIDKRHCQTAYVELFHFESL